MSDWDKDTLKILLFIPVILTLVLFIGDACSKREHKDDYENQAACKLSAYSHDYQVDPISRAVARRRFVCQPPRLLLPGEGPPARWSVALPLLLALAAGLLLFGGTP